MRDQVTGRLLPVPLEERFWPKVKKTDGCWLWQANTNDDGYGIICVGRRKFYAHRVSWEMAFGPLENDDACVLHACDTPACVRLDHLFLGSRADNALDMHTKGRNSAGIGIRHRKARLTEDEVREIHRRYQAGEKRVDLMLEFELDMAHLWRIGTGQIWRHLFTPAEEPQHHRAPS